MPQGRENEASQTFSASAHSQLEAVHLRVTLLLIVAALIPLSVVGVGAWVVFGRIIAAKNEAHLQTIVRDHAAVIDLFLAERIAALSLVSHSYDKDEIRDQAVLARILSELNANYAQSFQDLGVIDDDGRHLAYIGPYDLLGKNYRDAPWFGHVRQEGHYISDVFLGFRKVPHFIMAVRRDEPDGHFWILRASMNSEVFDRLVSRGRIGRTGDCFLIDSQGRYQTPPRGGGKVLDASEIRPPALIAEVRTVPARTADGRAVLRTMNWIKGGEWLVVVQQDEAEARAPVRGAMAKGMAVFAIGVVVIVMTASWTTRGLFRLLERTQAQKEKLDLQLLQASKLATVGEMATGVAHEINNPLAIIYSEQTNLSDLLAEMDAGDPRVAEMKDSVAQTKKQVERCKTITHKLLQFGRHGPAPEARIDPARELAEIVRLLANQARVNNIDLCMEIEGAAPPVQIDPGEFQQVVTNLVNNAMQAISETRGGILLSGWTEDGQFRLAVEDTGQGIPPENLDRIFEPFFTTKPVGKGTGLGLSVCYGIVTKWRGRIRAESGPGRGAVFVVQFPVAE